MNDQTKVKAGDVPEYPIKEELLSLFVSDLLPKTIRIGVHGAASAIDEPAECLAMGKQVAEYMNLPGIDKAKKEQLGREFLEVVHSDLLEPLRLSMANPDFSLSDVDFGPILIGFTRALVPFLTKWALEMLIDSIDTQAERTVLAGILLDLSGFNPPFISRDTEEALVGMSLGFVHKRLKR